MPWLPPPSLPSFAAGPPPPTTPLHSPPRLNLSSIEDVSPSQVLDALLSDNFHHQTGSSMSAASEQECDATESLLQSLFATSNEFQERLNAIESEVNLDGPKSSSRVAQVIQPLRQLLSGMRHHIRHAAIEYNSSIGHEEECASLPKRIDDYNPNEEPGASKAGYVMRETGLVKQIQVNPELYSPEVLKPEQVQQDHVRIRPLVKPSPESFLEIKAEVVAHRDAHTSFHFPACPPIQGQNMDVELEGILDEYVCQQSVRRVSYLVGEAASPAARHSFGVESVQTLSCGNLDKLLHSSCPGINTSYVYLAQSYSATAMHIEDAFLYSKNFCHAGWKLWLIVAPKSLSVLEDRLRRAFKSKLQSQTGSDFVRDLSVFVAPAQLRRWDVQFRVVMQGPGDLVVTYPKAYHQVMNLTDSLAEAINFAPGGWELDVEYTFRSGATNAGHLSRNDFYDAPTPGKVRSKDERASTLSRNPKRIAELRTATRVDAVADERPLRKKPRIHKGIAPHINYKERQCNLHSTFWHVRGVARG